MKINYVFLAGCLLLLSGSYGQQMDCTLGIGGRDQETIVRVFQLNESQQFRMEELMGELSLYQRAMENQIQELFDTHPQQSMEELQQLANKYQALKEEAEATSKAYDRKLLAVFDERQYRQYVSLCAEAKRKAMSPSLPSQEVKMEE